MKKLLVITLLVLSVTTNAQSKYFEKSLGWQYIHNGRSIFERSDGSYFVACEARPYDSGAWNAYYVLINANGDTISSTNQIMPVNYGVAITQGISTEYGYAISGYIGTNLSNPINFQNYVVRLNQNTELIDTTWVGSNISSSRCITRTPDGGYLLGGYIHQEPNIQSRHPYLIRLNANMEVVWDSTYIIPTIGFGLGYFTELIADTTDNSYYALSIASYQPYDLVWLHLDDSGTILDHRIFPSTPYDWPTNTADISIWGGDMIRAKDGDFVLSITEIQLDDPIGCYLLKLSPDGDTVRWKKEIDTIGYISKIYQLADSSFILGGSAYRLQNNNLSLQDVVAHVSASGDVLWKRVYGGTENDYIYDFIPTTDGSYFFTGRTESNLPNGGANVYLLKTNCMGLLTQPQAAFTATMDSAALTASFQNLSQFVYPDSIDGGHYLWQFGDGNTSTQANPTHTYTQGGNYTVTLTAVVCVDTSVFVQEVSTWATGTNNVVNTNGIKVFPNPANSYLTISSGQQEQLKGANFVLYNMLGQAIIKIPLLTGGAGVVSTQVNLTNIPIGVYLYQIICHNKNQTLQYGKVSIIH